METIELAFDKIINEARTLTHPHPRAFLPPRAAPSLRPAPRPAPRQKLNERKRVKGIKLEKKKSRTDEVKISLGPLDRVRHGPPRPSGPAALAPLRHREHGAARRCGGRRDAWTVPPQKTVLQRAVVFAFLAAWSLYQSAQTGPAFQVAVGFGLSAYYIHEKRPVKNLWGAMGAQARALCTARRAPQGAGPTRGRAASGGCGGGGVRAGQALIGLFVGWLAGSIVPVYVPVFPPALSPETIASLFSFVTLWMACTFFK